MRTLMVSVLLFMAIIEVEAQSSGIFPPSWRTGMKMNKVQLLIRDVTAPAGKKKVTINYPGIIIADVHEFANNHYLAVDLIITPEANAGNVKIIIEGGGARKEMDWRLEQRRPGMGKKFAQGVTSADLIYLVITDRFSNGDSGNDRIPGMLDQSLNRDSIYYRHGGDFRGIINHIDYIKSLGATALWLLPVMENNRPNRTEHGYAITDHYKIDPRFGGEENYRKLSDSLHANGMKLIMDAVYNHIGLEHFLENDPPAKNWMNRWPTYTQTSYREQVWFDPYVAPSDKKKMSDGWFDTIMPDINQNNPFMANYLIQNLIWYVEEYGIDGIRVDTYTYSDQDFANRCNKAIVDEYPNITMFGETRVFTPVSQSYFNENIFNTPFKSNLQGSVDFQCLYNGIIPSLTQSFGWMEGVNRLYNTLTNDFLNSDPMRNVLLLDNHDEPRFFSVVNENIEKQKIGYEWLLTCRGIPQLYYGSEVLMRGVTYPHDGNVRKDFPGGWDGDKKNAFTGKGLTPAEQSVLELVKKLANFRKNSPALKTGKMMHYIPIDGLYVYFRYNEAQTIMCVMNTGSRSVTLDFNKYIERTNEFTSARNVIDNMKIQTSSKPVIPPLTMWILELDK